jgi:hypothetical protein
MTSIIIVVVVMACAGWMAWSRWHYWRTPIRPQRSAPTVPGTDYGKVEGAGAPEAMVSPERAV